MADIPLVHWANGPGAEHPRRANAIRVLLLILNALVVGGCINLWLVRRLLFDWLSSPEAGNLLEGALFVTIIVYGCALLALVLASLFYWALLRMRVFRLEVR